MKLKLKNWYRLYLIEKGMVTDPSDLIRNKREMNVKKFIKKIK